MMGNFKAGPCSDTPIQVFIDGTVNIKNPAALLTSEMVMVLLPAFVPGNSALEIQLGNLSTFL